MHPCWALFQNPRKHLLQASGLQREEPLNCCPTLLSSPSTSGSHFLPTSLAYLSRIKTTANHKEIVKLFVSSFKETWLLARWKWEPDSALSYGMSPKAALQPVTWGAESKANKQQIAKMKNLRKGTFPSTFRVSHSTEQRPAISCAQKFDLWNNLLEKTSLPVEYIRI